MNMFSGKLCVNTGEEGEMFDLLYFGPKFSSILAIKEKKKSDSNTEQQKCLPLIYGVVVGNTIP